MLRLLTTATLLLIVACLIISASIALADAPGAPGVTSSDADQPTTVDIYEFDFPIKTETLPNPEFKDVIAAQDI